MVRICSSQVMVQATSGYAMVDAMSLSTSYCSWVTLDQGARIRSGSRSTIDSMSSSVAPVNCFGSAAPFFVTAS